MLINVPLPGSDSISPKLFMLETSLGGYIPCTKCLALSPCFDTVFVFCFRMSVFNFEINDSFKSNFCYVLAMSVTSNANN